ncbi:MAG TPA: hypothetical protein VH062_01260 [Polyangiaceae bacterium]|jgi:hypothetical protein|nr:hypothetical protein [Polyangiaceae bacterium]
MRLLLGMALASGVVSCSSAPASSSDGSGPVNRESEKLDPAGATAVQQAYDAWGGASSGLGAATTDVLPTPDGTGVYQQYQGGAIYWTANTGAHMVFQAIRDKWGDLGWETGFLGYPIDDTRAAPDGRGFFSYFQNGAIYWSPDTGAHEVHGAILGRWGELGWEQGSLGYPTSDETDSPVGGRMNTFQGGALYWSNCVGVTDAPQGCTLIATGDCNTDADCGNGATCNNPFDNAQGNCTSTIDTYSGDPVATIHWTSGDDFNSCTTNAVPNELADMDQYAYTQVSFDQREEVPLPPDNESVPMLGGLGGDCSAIGVLEGDLPWDHLQSLVRLPGSSGENWIAASIDTHGSSDGIVVGGVLFAQLGQVNGNGGEPFRAGQNDDRNQNRAQAYYTLPAPHPGGMQVLGRTLAVALDQDTNVGQPSIYFIDVSNPTGKHVDDAIIDRVPLQSMVYPSGVDAPTSITAVAVVPLATGFLMAVNSGASVWLYLTNYSSIGPDTHWYFHNHVAISNGPGAENMTFLTECDGTVYLLTASNQQGGSLGENGIGNSVNMHKLVKDGDKLSLSLFGNRNSFVNDGYADFRASATFYVSPQGEIALYAASRSLLCRDDNFKMAEFLVPHFCGLGGC